MGGVIGVQSTVGQGSVFWVEMNLTHERLSIAPFGTPVAAAPLQGPVDKDIRTLLYVEDNPANRMLVETLMERRPGIRLLTAGDGWRGIALAQQEQPDVILMDINLPGISGIKALKILEQDPLTAHIPVVALSANAMPHDVVKGLEAGFFRYLTKPIKVNEFMDTLDEAMKFAKAVSAHVQKEVRT
jgi:CheY-like chemotaxis protein